MDLITSKSNPNIKFVRALRQSSIRKAHGLFIVEGIRHVGEAYEASQSEKNIHFHSIIFSPDKLTSTFALELVEKAVSQGIHCIPVSGPVFDSVVEKDNPQGIIAIVQQPDLTLEALSPDTFCVGVALVTPQDPGNVGTIIRTIDGVGADGLIIIDGQVDPFHPGSVRASMGTIFWYPVIQANFFEFQKWCREHEVFILGTSAHAENLCLNVKYYRKPLILLSGSEREGLSENYLEICNEVVKLPMRGRASSLNLGVAVGVFLYTLLGEKM